MKTNHVKFGKIRNLALSSGKIDKYQYLTDDKILPPVQSTIIIEQAKLTYSTLGKAFEIKIIEN